MVGSSSSTRFFHNTHPVDWQTGWQLIALCNTRGADCCVPSITRPILYSRTEGCMCRTMYLLFVAISNKSDNKSNQSDKSYDKNNKSDKSYDKSDKSGNKSNRSDNKSNDKSDN